MDIGMQGRTPLHYAAFKIDVESIKMLLHFGANVNAVDNQVHPLI